jgi:hypothetical protein
MVARDGIEPPTPAFQTEFNQRSLPRRCSHTSSVCLLLKIPALVVAPLIEAIWLGFGEVACSDVGHVALSLTDDR